ncbi:MAG: S-layer homology domain-containing protein [Acidimicrobiia bacterium]|nr:S-layer homology domain-containing protein [Acidimicrobiia bacterium]
MSSPLHRRPTVIRLLVLPLIVLLVAASASTTAAGATSFPDVPPDHPFAFPIDWAVTSGVTTGFADDTFRPTIPVSRQAFAAFLWRATSPGTAAPPCPPGVGPFTDVPADHPFCAEITWLVDQGIASGYDDGSFRPTAAISRQAMAAFLFRAYSGVIAAPCPVGAGPFSDVPSNHPFCAEISWMVDQEITTGYGDGTFRPTAPISRQAGVAFLWRAVGEPDGVTERVSIDSSGGQADFGSGMPALSADGRYVAFFSEASNLVPGDTNETGDVFVHDRSTGTTERVSIATDGTEANDASGSPSISADGRFVAFTSEATNLVPGDTNNATDIFVRDRIAGTTQRVSVSSNGDQANSGSLNPSISADGRYVAYASFATNLVPGDTNGVADIFVRDLTTGATERVSTSAFGAQTNGASFAPSISANGNVIAYHTSATNVVTGDTNGVDDVIVHNRTAPAQSANQRVSVASDGTQANGLSGAPSISADGRHVAFVSLASNLVPNDTNGLADVFVRDRTTGTTERASVGPNGTEANGPSGPPAISADGRHVAFASPASNLVAGDTNGTYDVFVRNRVAFTTTRVSVASNGSQTDNVSDGPAIAANGRYVAFGSFASNLVPGDTNNRTDVFVRTRVGVS